VTLLCKFLSNRKCGLRWKEALRAAMLDRQLSKTMGRKK
jgi:hypothetical protein